MSVLVLGIGNLVMADDGVGVRVVQLLNERHRFPEGVTVLDGGTLGLDLLPQLEGISKLLVVDAVECDGEPGTLVRLTGEDIPLALQTKVSPHQMGLKDLLTVASLMGHTASEMVLLGVKPGSIEMSMELTPAVQAQVEPLAGLVLQELHRWGASPC
ncbi:HyaD/HybD family hydrogenase maturation endopeptidase [Geomonas sp. Red32]|uniref:HyaD/HybD family hydrogenase maturation endopeptidase n=1 Tax=Geomonas sp. Red32 TaxID=2912856 RepID=UPI00202CCE51|nr:HyaD/HybD family hydrogenase maturation endopeptidase [Geomonas sp. Red32]MCM0084407.1 HyaD/HybD family hydrogenase maturation endopeptidase [Geomonas sp. Red32]